uniref:Gasdermin pore forming domain-containing protein n=1 Tax=Ursus americanus TaxID=9643 RepID=A0A452SRW7_URSAM
MSSLFARDARSVVRELSRRGELVPADSLNSTPHLRPFCLVRKKHRHHPCHTQTCLLRRLAPAWTSLPTELNRGQSIPIQEMVAGAVTGAMSVSTGLPVQVTGNSGVIHSSTLTVHTLMVSPNTWETLMKRKLRTPKPLFLRELQRQKEKESLYVVTEAVETIHDTMLQSLSNTEGAGRLAFLGPGHLKVQGVP